MTVNRMLGLTEIGHVCGNFSFKYQKNNVSFVLNIDAINEQTAAPSWQALNALDSPRERLEE